MAIEAPYSKYRIHNCFIIIGVFIAISGWCIYDGYMNEKWIKEHTNDDGSPMAYLIVNRTAPFVLLPSCLLAGAFWFLVKDKKLVGDENELIISENEKIGYDSIEKIDKTHYEKKGFFVITYKTPSGNEEDKTISYKTYDNTKKLLEHIVSKIS
jgi:hypothetical protein